MSIRHKVLIILLCAGSVSFSFAKESSMKKRSTASLPAAEAPKKLSNRLEAWLKRMKKNVASTKTKHNRLVSVAAVRGAEVKDAPPLYWKGKRADGPLQPEELDAFAVVIEAASKGDDTGAKASYESFLAAYPNSPLKPEGEEMLQILAMEDSK